MKPESAIAALVASFQSTLAATFPVIGRRLDFASKVAEQPALFITHYSDSDSWSGNGLPITSVELRLFVYTNKYGVDDVPDTALNALKDAIAGALASDDPASGEFTLGGQVSWVRISGKTEFYPGDIGNQAIAVIPVTILLTM